MPSVARTLGVAVAGLAAVASALPAMPKFSNSQMKAYQHMRRQNAAAAAAGLDDNSILNFALTLEWLEASFYQQGFEKFPASEFQALGLNAQQIADLQGVGLSEQAHVVALQSTLAQAGAKPVEPCTYNFGFTTAKDMIATAGILESVGISAYLGAAPLVSNAGVLSAAASIVTIESRHQAFVRAASGQPVAPGAFDTALPPRSVFSLAAPFIQSCPDGSNLAITAFPPLTSAGANGTASNAAAQPGATLQLASSASQGATACSFTNGGQPGGSVFTPFTAAGGCQVPQGLSGVAYVHLVNSSPNSGVLTENLIVAGPMVMVAS